MKRIVVTGAKGGTGVSIVKVLRGAGYDVLGIDVKPVDRFEVGYVRHDLTDAAGLNDLFAGADGIVHFGSYPTDSWCSWTEAFHNVMVGGFNVFQASANVGIKRIVFASSMEVYGDLFQQPHLPVTEQSPLAPPGIYGSSKHLLEKLATDYCRWHGMAIAGLRLNRIVYECSYDWRIKPYVQKEDGAADVLWGYIDARDVATACQKWLESDLGGFMVFNIAAANTCIETPTRQLLERYYAKITDIRVDYDDHACLYDSSLLCRTLDWQAHVDWRTIRDEAKNRAQE